MRLKQKEKKEQENRGKKEETPFQRHGSTEGMRSSLHQRDGIQLSQTETAVF